MSRKIWAYEKRRQINEVDEIVVQVSIDAIGHLGLPFHADDDDGGEDDDGDGADDAHVVEAVVDDPDVEGLEQVVERLAEADDVHGHGHGVGHREDHADGGAELGSQRARDHVVCTT